MEKKGLLFDKSLYVCYDGGYLTISGLKDIFKNLVMNTFKESLWNKQHHIVDQLYWMYSHQMLNYDAMESIAKLPLTSS